MGMAFTKLWMDLGKRRKLTINNSFHLWHGDQGRRLKDKSWHQQVVVEAAEQLEALVVGSLKSQNNF
jgi:hypothetical protein